MGTVGARVYEESAYGPLFIGTVERVFSSVRRGRTGRVHSVRVDDTIVCGRFELQTVLVWSRGRWRNYLRKHARYVVAPPPE